MHQSFFLPTLGGPNHRPQHNRALLLLLHVAPLIHFVQHPRVYYAGVSTHDGGDVLFYRKHFSAEVKLAVEGLSSLHVLLPPRGGQSPGLFPHFAGDNLP